jgi:tripartite ATP-independent transporter DctP family solute receptor
MKKFLPLLALAGALAMSLPAMAQNARLGYVPTEDHPVGKAAVFFAEKVKDKTGGRITVETFGNGILGSEPQLQSSIQGGFLDIMFGPTSNLVGAVPGYLIFDLPFFYKDFAAVDAVMDGEVGKELFNRLDTELGIIGLAYMDNGFRHITNAVRPINTVDDLKGLKIRVIPNPLFLATFETLGTNPVPLPYPELFNALEGGAVEAQETPVGLIYASRFYEVQDHLALTGHVYTPFVLLASKKWFNSLSAEDQALVMEAAQETAVYQRDLSRGDADRLVGLLEEEGMEVTRPSEEAMNVLRERTAPVIDQFTDQIGADLVDKARAAMSAVAN